MIERRVLVGSQVGLHARPASLFVQAAAATGVPVTIAKGDGEGADARSILSVLSLDARGGDEVVLRTDDDSDAGRAALDHLADLLSRDLDAEQAS